MMSHLRGNLLLLAFTVVIHPNFGSFDVQSLALGALPLAMAAAAQAIVVLTGHAGIRIQAGARLLEQGKATKMLVSGVNQKASRADILSVSKSSKRELARTFLLSARVRFY